MNTMCQVEYMIIQGKSYRKKLRNSELK